MLKIRNILNIKTISFLSVLLYISFSLLTLTRFPFVHSDETWLSGLSRNIMETADYAVTETFFDLYPRNPHAIKSVFHTLQIIFIQFFGYNIFTIRLLSLIFGLFSLFWFYKLCKYIFGSSRIASLATFFLAIDIQFIYASHFARQEIILLFVLIFSLYYFISNLTNLRLRQNLFLGIIVGLSIGLHPNSFIISLPLGILYLFHIVITKKLKIAGLLIYAFTVACFALVFIAFSYAFDANFFVNYLNYGSQFGVTNTLTSKTSEIVNFYLKLYYGVSGTYYTPNIRFEFYLFGLSLMTSLFLLFKESNKNLKEGILGIILCIIAINAGIISIGRFNQTSIIFIVPFFYILVTYVLFKIKKIFRIYLAVFLALIISFNSVTNILPYLSHSYESYLFQIGKVVKSEETVLANLNAEMYFENGKLYDYRNLAFLKEKSLTFEQYIYFNKIEYIIYPDEMDFIYAYRPLWNNVYGNISLYYEEMQDFLRNKSLLVYEFPEPTYGMRISKYINQKDWKIRIYKVNQ